MTGLNDNFEASVELFENLLSNAIANEEALRNLKIDVIKKRNDAKLDKGIILRSGLANYAKYGPQNPFTNQISEKEIMSTSSDELLNIVKSLTSFKHRILYYGPLSIDELSDKLTNLP